MPPAKKTAPEPVDEPVALETPENGDVVVTMLHDMAGTIVGRPIPRRGEQMVLPSSEAQVLIRNGQAKEGVVELDNEATLAVARGDSPAD